jgi:hypothetical protein
VITQGLIKHWRCCKSLWGIHFHIKSTILGGGSLTGFDVFIVIYLRMWETPVKFPSVKLRVHAYRGMLCTRWSWR